MFLKLMSGKFTKLLIKIPLVDRWLIGQLLPPMLFAIGAFTAVSLSVGIMFDLVRKIVEFGLPFQIALKVMILKYSLMRLNQATVTLLMTKKLKSFLKWKQKI